MPTYFSKPRVGQPMRFRASPTETIDGFVSTVKTFEGIVTRPDGTQTENWSAEIVSGATSTARITYRTEVTPDSWQPLPEDDLEAIYGEGFARLRASIADLSVDPYDDTGIVAAIAALSDATTRLSERVDALEALGKDVTDIKATLRLHWEAIQRLGSTSAAAPTDNAVPTRRR